MKSKRSTPRKRLTRWAGWFFFANTIIFLLIGLAYVPNLPNYDATLLVNFRGELMAASFVVLAFVGQAALYAYAICAVVLLLILCVPKRGFIFTMSILLASFASFLLVSDAIIFHLYRYHLGALVWQIIKSGVFSQVIVLSSLEWVSMLAIALGLFCVESFLAFWIWKKLQRSEPQHHGRLIGLCLVASLFLSYTLYLAAGFTTTAPGDQSVLARSNDQLIVSEAKSVPYYISVLSDFVPGEKSFQKLLNTDTGILTSDKQVDKKLKYPLHPLSFKTPKKRYNIVIIGIDTWRFDMMNKAVTPNIATFAKNAWTFTDNYSGGNSTRPGIFSLFYSIPSNYWTAMLDQHRSPVFIKQLIKDHYQTGIFSSASLEYPAFDATVFRDVKDLQLDTPGDSPADRDRNITNEFNRFIQTRNKNKPFFSFLFYDAVHGYCETGTRFKKPFQPEISECNRIVLSNDTNPLPYMNRYRNALLFDDGLIGKVLNTLKWEGLLKNTIVIITADHGEEFNDEHLDYWGHSSAFDPYQVRTPLIIYWPGTQPKRITHRTSHYDIVPTLMEKVLGCTSPISDYSVGNLLLSKNYKPYLIVGSYVNYAILQKHRSTLIYPGGDYDITYPNGHDMPHAKLDSKLLQQVYKDLNRYFN